MRFMTDVSLRIYVPADHICTWRLINFDLFIGPRSSPFRGAAAPFWSFKRGSVWIFMQFNSMMWAFFLFSFFFLPEKLKRHNDATKRKLCTHCWPGRKFACFGESNYNQKENVLFHADCRKSLSFPFSHTYFLLCMLSSCNSGLKQLLKGNYDAIVPSSRDVMQELEDSNEFHGEEDYEGVK